MAVTTTFTAAFTAVIDNNYDILLVTLPILNIL